MPAHTPRSSFASIDLARPAVFVLVDIVFAIQGAAFALSLVHLRRIVDMWTDGRSLLLPACGPATPRMAALVQSAAVSTAPVPPRKAVAIPSVLSYLIVAAGVPVFLAATPHQPGQCGSTSGSCSLGLVGVSILLIFDATVAAVPWIAVILLSTAIDAATPRIKQPLAALAATAVPHSEPEREDGGASRRVWAAYRGAVRQADALSSQFASLWFTAIASTAVGIVASVITAWNAAFGADPVVSNASGTVGVLSAYSTAQCLALGMLLHHAALVHTRASAALAQAAATEGDISLSDRGALYSMLQQRPIAFTVYEVAITEGLLLRVLAGLATGVLPPVLKLLLGE